MKHKQDNWNKYMYSKKACKTDNLSYETEIKLYKKIKKNSQN